MVMFVRQRMTTLAYQGRMRRGLLGEIACYVDRASLERSAGDK